MHFGLRQIRTPLLVATAMLVTSCAGNAYRAGDPCVADGFTVVDSFAGARRGTCTLLSANKVQLDILPESSGRINDSPWYAFRIEPTGAAEALISLYYTGGHHRYKPKVSNDGLRWLPLEDRYVSTTPDRRRTDITVPLGDEAVWISAQELVTPPVYEVWERKTAARTGVSRILLGKSRAGLSIHMFDTDTDGKEVLFLVGRQHPPEVSGAFAFFAFAETVLGESELARQFRERFRVIAIPLLNPDGVAGGNWRHNLGDVDLNRDWGRFTQPETAIVGKLLDSLDATNARLRMFIDFHSTKENVFYTQLDPTDPPGFTAKWLDNAAARIVNYPFRNGQGPATSPNIAKNYIFTRYGIPSVTFEVGDESDREAVRAAARVFAEELMHLMLEQTY